MAIIRCAKGHYYDNVKFSRCPHCGVFVTMADEMTMAMPRGLFFDNDDDKTIALDNDDDRTIAFDEDDDKTIALSVPEPKGAPEMLEDEDKTISHYAEEKGKDFLTGWMVCVKGAERGKDYRLHQGFNRVGRDPSMDVAVMGDLSIGRTAACAIVYDDKTNRFFVVPQPGAKAYLNGSLIQGTEDMQSGDLLRVGESEFEFIAFCREGRVWE